MAVRAEIIHQIWIGDAPLSSSYNVSWSRLHPDWEYYLWTESDVLATLNRSRQSVLDEFNLPVHVHPAHLSEIYRLMLLHEFGGVYADVDTECLKPFGDLLRYDFVAFGSWMNAHGLFVNNDVMCSAPRSAMVKRLLNIQRSQTAPYDRYRFAFTHGYDMYCKEALRCADGDTLVLGLEAANSYRRHFFDRSWMS